ncbi:MAG TPA: hypothetical protein VHX60_08875, partial [Acidobacteriaceae bacterium]|nr:hypothetical protein [Acidobacteriaceae bacterium]
LQQYESYEIIRYFDNIAPGRNGGGWVDTYGIRYIDRYAEQLWDTMLAKAPQIMLFNWNDLVEPAKPGAREAWQNEPTSFEWQQLEARHRQSGSNVPINFASVAGYSLDTVDAVVGKLGNPIGIASYKPYQSTGEDFLHNYLGMIGVPIDLHPTFPTDAKLVLLTESAKFDPQIVTKIKAQLMAGKDVVITSGLLKALQDKGINDICELRYPGRKLSINDYWGAFGAGGFTDLGAGKNMPVLVPEIDFLTNDAWPLVSGTANGNGAPLLLMDRYGKGILFVLTIPDNFNDLYSLPQPVLTTIRGYLLRDFPVQIDAPSQVSLFAYDNHSFVVESYRDSETTITASVLGNGTKLRNLATGEIINGESSTHRRAFFMPNAPQRTSFTIKVEPHSFVAFAEE